jgi:hypothetical protein
VVRVQELCMHRFGRILSLIVCFQLAWGCQSNSPVTDTSSGPAAGYTEISGSVTLALMKVSEILIPSAAAADLAFRAKTLASKSSGFSAEGMSSTILESCNPEEVAVAAADRVSAAEVKVGAEQEAKKVARLVDYSDLSSPCLIKEIELNFSEDGKTASYKAQVENELVEDRVVALVYGDDEKGVYKNAIFSIEKGARIIKQHLSDESSVKAEILGTQIKNEVADLEFTDEVKSQIRDRIKELKEIEDFGFDLLGDKEKMISLLKDPSFKDSMITALIEARNTKESESESDASRVSAVYSEIINIGTNAASSSKIVDGVASFELNEFLHMKCSPDHVFVAKHGKKEYVLQFASSNSIVLEKMSSNWGRKAENGRFYFDPASEVSSLNGHIGKLFYVVRELMKELKTKISFKLILSDVEKKESDRSCSITIAPPSLDFAALENFNFKAYESPDEAMAAHKMLLEKLHSILVNKFSIEDGSVDEEESKVLEEQMNKAYEIITATQEKIAAYFKSFYAKSGLGLDLTKLSSFAIAGYKSPEEAREALRSIWQNLYQSFEEKLKLKVESKEISEEEMSQIRDFQIRLGKEQHHKVYLAINNYFHTLNLSKKLGIELSAVSGLDYKSYLSRDEAQDALKLANSDAQEKYKLMMESKIKSGEITQEESDKISKSEFEFSNNLYWTIYNAIEQFFNN